MATIPTARGAIDTAELGTTLMHEHVFVLNHELAANRPRSEEEDHAVDHALERLRGLSDRGVDTIVDLTVLGLGRDVPRLLEVATRTEVNIVLATGFYTFTVLPSWVELRGPGRRIEGPEPLTELFVRDLTEGIADTGVRAAVLKVATDKPGITPGVERVLRSICDAHLETGAPISTHADASTRRGLEQQAFFRQARVDLTRVVIGHCGDTDDLGYLREIADAGSYLGMDRFGMDTLFPMEDRVRTVAELCQLGYADRIVLSHDASCFSHNFDAEFKQRVFPNWHYHHISDDVLPALLRAGVTQEQIDTMLIDNPRRFFEAGGSR
jgi:phosphotriesterase-related protein